MDPDKVDTLGGRTNHAVEDLRGRPGDRPVLGHRTPSDPPPAIGDVRSRALAAMSHPAGCRCVLHFQVCGSEVDDEHTTARLPKAATRPYEVPRVMGDDEARAVATEVIERGPGSVRDADLRALARHVLDRIPPSPGERYG